MRTDSRGARREAWGQRAGNNPGAKWWWLDPGNRTGSGEIRLDSECVL